MIIASGSLVHHHHTDLKLRVRTASLTTVLQQNRPDNPLTLCFVSALLHTRLRALSVEFDIWEHRRCDIGAPNFDSLQALVDHLAHRIRRSVAVDDARMHFLSASRHFGDEDPARVRAILNRNLDRASARWLLSQGIETARSMVLIPESKKHQLAARRCFPIRVNERLLGWLWLIGDGEVEENILAAEYAEAIGKLLVQQETEFDDTARRVDALVRDLVFGEGDSTTIRDQCDALGLISEGDSVCAVVIHYGSTMPSQERNRASKFFHTLLSPEANLNVASTILQGVPVLAFFGRPEHLSVEVAPLMTRLIQQTEIPHIQAVIGQVQPIQDFVVSAVSAAQMGVAVRVLKLKGTVFRSKDLAPWPWLIDGLSQTSLSDLVVPGVLALIEDPKNDALVTTAETYLDCNGDSKRAALGLHVHRSTLYYRLDRVQQISGLDARSGSDALSLYLGIKLHRVAIMLEEATSFLTQSE